MGSKVKTAFFVMLGLGFGAKAVGMGNVETSITHSSSSPTIPCSINIENFKYDLCPLLQANARYLKLSISEDTPPTLTTKTYDVSLEGALKRDGTLPAELQCPGGTWICLTVTNARPNHSSEPTRILQVVPVAGFSSDVTHIDQNADPATGDLTPKFKLIRTDLNENDTEAKPESKVSLRMTLHGGTYTGQKQKASFIFKCDRSREKMEKMSGMALNPKFIWSFNGTHTFEWKSAHACPEILVSHPPEKGGGSKEDDEDADPPADPDEEDPIESRTPPSTSNNPHTYYLLLLPILLFIVYTASKKLFPTSTRRLWSLLRRWKFWLPSSHQYRSLVDDPAASSNEEVLRGYEGNAEIFGYGGFEGEEIPLTPSPRRETFGYGVLR